MLRRCLHMLCCLALCASAATSAVAADEAPLPPLSGRVVDTVGALPADARAALASKLAAFEAQKGAQVVVVIVPTTAPDSIEQFGIRLMDAWKIGRKGIDDGAILIVASEERQLRIEVGYGLEGALSDVVAHRIIDETMVPKLQAGDLPGAVDAGVSQMLAVIGGEALPPPTAAARPAGNGGVPGFARLGENTLLFGLGALILLGTALRYFLGDLIGSGVTGSIAGALGWLFTGSLVGAGVAFFGGVLLALFGLDLLLSVLFSGGRGGGGSFGGGGGFSGGGGRGGGGGASGSW